MSNIKVYTFCQMSMTKHHSNRGICEDLYIYVTNMCHLVTRYTFDKLIPKFTEYTSYEVMYIDSEVTHHV